MPRHPDCVVIDTNVFVAAGFRRDGAAAAILEDVRGGHLRLVWNDATRSETERVLRRIPPLRGFPVEDLFRDGDRFPGETHPERFGRVADPEDREFAALAHAAGATLISSDDHLLAPDSPGLVAMSPREFLRTR